MAKKVAIEWDSNHLRMVVARPRGSGIAVEQALSIPLTQDGAAEEGSSDTHRARILADQVAGHGFSKLPALLAVKRSDIELQVLTLPQVPDEELPDLIRFQAIREFGGISEDGTIDFLKLPAAEDGRIRVLATAISGKQRKNYAGICEKAQLQLQSLNIRPLGVCHLVAAQSNLSDSHLLIVDAVADRIEFSAMVDGEVVLSRATRLPGRGVEDDNIAPLIGEIRRTVIASQGVCGKSFGTLVVIGKPTSESPWQRLAAELQMSVEFLDPLHAEHVHSTIEIENASSGQYAALIGLLLNDATHLQPGIDFQNSRRKPDPPDLRRLYTLATLTAATVVLGIVYLLWSGLSSKQADIERLQSELAELKNDNKEWIVVEDDIKEIDGWVKADVVWIDELYLLSETLPPADDMIATRLLMQTSADVGGTITLEGYVSDPSAISKLENSLRDDQHQALGRESKAESFGDGYSWRFQEYITVTPEERDRFADIVNSDGNDSDDSDSDSGRNEATESSSAEEEMDGDNEPSTEDQDGNPEATETVSVDKNLKGASSSRNGS